MEKKKKLKGSPKSPKAQEKPKKSPDEKSVGKVIKKKQLEGKSAVKSPKSPKLLNKSKKSPDDKSVEKIATKRKQSDGKSTEKIKKKKPKISPFEKALTEIQTSDNEEKEVKSNGVQKKGEEKKNKKNLKRKKLEDDDATPTKVGKVDVSKKERKKQRKMVKDTYELSTKMKEIWEELRVKTIEEKKKKELSNSLFKLVKGRARQIIFAHDTVRVMQTLIKSCSTEQRDDLFEELKDDILEMIRSKYARFFVRQILKCGSKTQCEYVIRSMHGNVKKLMKHKQASQILEVAYNEHANNLQRSNLVEEFYGPSFALFKTAEARTLSEILTANPEKKESILKNLRECLLAVIDKSLLEHSIVHRLLSEYMEFADVQQKTEMSENLREQIARILHTRDGSRVAMNVIWYTSAKDRKAIIKSFKTYVKKICLEEHGHLVLCALFDTVDDTKMIEKAILSELFGNLSEIAADAHGKQVVLYLMAPRDKKYFHPAVSKILEKGDGNPYSKKDMDKRRSELRAAVEPQLIEYVKENAEKLLTDNLENTILQALLFHGSFDKKAIFKALADVACKKFGLEENHVISDPVGHWTLKRLVLKEPGFAKVLVEEAKEKKLQSWSLCNRGCFVLLSLLEQDDVDIKDFVKEALNPVKNNLKREKFPGAKILSKNI